MEGNSTLSGKCIILITVVTFFFLSLVQAQTISPKLRLSSSVLIPGTAEPTTCKLSNVIAGLDAFIKIEDIENGSTLVNIDDS